MAAEKVEKPEPREVLSGLRELLLDSEVSKVEPILEEMLLLYWPPFKAADSDELLRFAIIGARAYVEDLCEFSQETIKTGWREARRKQKTMGWPTIQVIRDACLEAQKPQEQRKVKSPTETRMDQYRRTGFWAEHWGARPESSSDRERVHQEWLARLSPSQRESYEETLRRVKNGESMVVRFEELGAGNELPILPHERLSSSEAARRREESIRRAQ